MPSAELTALPLPLPAPKLATYADLKALPANVVGEIVAGELHVHPRPAAPHLVVTSALGGELHGPFQRGRGGPGGWVILDEPELHLDNDVVVPDLAGWRRERFPAGDDAPYFTVAPDWICEVLSPSTARLDRIKKMRTYATAGIPHVWHIDPQGQSLEVFTLQSNGAYSLTPMGAGHDKVEAPPFEAFELDLAALWNP